MRVERSYKIQFKRQVISRAAVVGVDAAWREDNVPRRTVGNWVDNKEAIMSFSGSAKSKTLKGQGRKEMIPFSRELVLYMKDERRDNNIVTTRMMIDYMKEHHHDWLIEYLGTKKNEDSAQKALYALCQNFAKRHGFSSRAPVSSNV
ncbi:hypothetical protein L915_21593 [Phytophthora nicotianae]|uniref:DDE-1 domain-containing protein n=1 Tax=Phytophthora nicotianae TaxID=4792 RepID=W2FK10_PHYNI|nr:hypothetical protein L915_21593 [Phytophthora nicotianae]